jgi:16S rRNA G966 N2-methylase RsmD
MENIINRILRAINYSIRAILFEWPRGINFSMRDKYSSNDASLNGYARTSKNALINLYKFVNINNKNFLDIGSGKGAVIFDTFSLGAKISHGIEFNQKLHKIAVSNFDKLKCNDSCVSINIDAREFKNYRDYDIFFLFNPFNEKVYWEVMSVISQQISDNKVRWIIAYGKSNESAIMSIKSIKLVERGVCPYRKTGFSIYKIN